MARRDDKPSNWAKVKHLIDRGETREKVNKFDPAAAPLGTDEEAGGASTHPDDIAASVQPRRDESGTAHKDNTRQ